MFAKKIREVEIDQNNVSQRKKKIFTEYPSIRKWFENGKDGFHVKQKGECREADETVETRAPPAILYKM